LVVYKKGKAFSARGYIYDTMDDLPNLAEEIAKHLGHINIRKLYYRKSQKRAMWYLLGLLRRYFPGMTEFPEEE